MSINISTNKVLKGLINSKIYGISGLEKGSQKVVFNLDTATITLQHFQDCCESVWLEDFESLLPKSTHFGEFRDIQLLSFEERIVENYSSQYESSTATFYEIKTNKGDLWLRFVGESNGCYSESINVTVKLK